MRYIASVRLFSHYISMAYLDPQKTQKDPSASTIERTLSPPAHANCNFPAANARPFIPFSDLCHEAERESFRGDPLREVSTAQACFVELSLAPIPLSTPPDDTRDADDIFVSRSLDHLLGDKLRCS